MVDEPEKIAGSFVQPYCRRVTQQGVLLVIRGHLAIYSKLEGELNDYRVLRQSEPAWSANELGREIFAASIRTDVPLPKTKRDLRKVRFLIGTGIPPGMQDLHLYVMSRAWTSYGDHASRFVAAFCALFVPFRDAAAANLSVRELVEHLPAWNEIDPRVRGPLPTVEITPSRHTLKQRAHEVDRLGFERCAALAALALEQPLALIADTQGFSDEYLQRADILDAILSLLPYGCRAGIPVSTWNEVSDQNVVERIGFFAHPGSGKSGINLDSGDVVVEPQSSEARLLIRNLNLLRKETGSSAKVVELLSAFHHPIQAASVHSASKAVETLLRPREVLRRVRSNTASPSEVFALFSEGLDTTMSESDELAFIDFLIRSRSSADDLNLARSRWSSRLERSVLAMALQQATLSGDAAQGIFNQLTALAIEKRFVRQVIQFVLSVQVPEKSRTRSADPVLSTLMQSPHFNSPELQHEVNHQLGRDIERMYLFTLLLGECVLENQQLAIDWLTGLVNSSSGISSDLANAAAVAAGIIDEDLPADTFAHIAGGTNRSVVPFLNLALRHSDWKLPFTHLLPTLCLYIATQRVDVSPKTTNWQQQLLDQIPSGELMGSPIFQGRWDMLRVILGQSPIFTEQVNSGARPIYSSEIQRRIDDLPNRIRNSKPMRSSWKKLARAIEHAIRQQGESARETLDLYYYLQTLLR